MTRPNGDTPRQVRIRIVHDKQLELMQLEVRIAAGLGPGGPTRPPAKDPEKRGLRRPGPGRRARPLRTLVRN